MAAQVMTNWIARLLGGMSIRVGWQYITNTQGNAFAKTLPFVFSTTDTARVEVTANGISVLINDQVITRVAVTSSVTNGALATNLTGWSVSDQTGAASSWLPGGGASLLGNGVNEAILDQQVNTSTPNVEHALRIVILRGPVMFRCGTIQGDDSYVNETALGTGTHSLAFTPTGPFWIRFFNSNLNASQLGSCNVEAAGVMILPSPWAQVDLQNLRRAQSADVIYVCCTGSQEYQPRKIQRRSTRSWSIVLFEPTTGPFKAINTTPITITASGLQGDITLSASQPLFKPLHVGALMQISSVGQIVTASIASQNTFTNAVRVNGIGSQRGLTISISGSFSAKVSLQYSVGSPGTWVDVNAGYTGTTSFLWDDGLDNSVIYYRLGIESGNYTSGTAVCTLSFPGGSITGNCRIRAYTDSQHVSASVLTIDAGTLVGLNSLGQTTATTLWALGAFSNQDGWPQTACFHEGKLFLFGSTIKSSVADDFENFDAFTVGDAGPLQEVIADGPIDNISWALSMQRLAVGLPGSCWSARSSSLDGPLTPTDFVIRPFSTIGAANIDAVRVDKSAVYAQISGTRLMRADMDIYTYDYKAQDMTLFVPDLLDAGIVQIAVQRIPDTRYHIRRADGTVAVLVEEAAENVSCWQEITTNGFVEDINVLPGTPEDQVYYTVNRTINGQTVRFHEKWALESNCTGLPVAQLADAFSLFSSAAPTNVITGLAYLNGAQVVCWGWNTVSPFTDSNGVVHGVDYGLYTVNGGQITLTGAPVTNACVGLGYAAQWQSMKQAFAAALGTPLNMVRRIDEVGLMLQNTHVLGVHFGPTFDTTTLDDIPYDEMPRIAATDNTSSEPQADLSTVMPEFEARMEPLDGKWSTDQRVCITAAAPRPATCLALSVAMTTSG